MYAWNERGSSVLEGIVAVGLFAIVAVGLSPSLLSSRKVADLSHNSSIATALAADKIEYFRARGYNSVIAGSESGIRANGASGGIFNRTWTVTNNSPSFGIRRVVVTVSWRERQSTPSVSVVGLIAQ